MKKFELTTDFITIGSKKLFRIKALVNFGNVREGELGGYIEKVENLSQDGDAWVYDNAMVYGDAVISGDAVIYGNARVYRNSWVYGNARVYGNAEVSGDARVYGNARVYGDAWVHGDTWTGDNARVYGDAEVYGNTWVYDNAVISGYAVISGDAVISGNAWVYDNADYATIKGFGTQFRNTTFFRCKDGTVRVSFGCFLGTIPEFREQVNKTRDGKIAKEYQLIADLMEYHFNKED